ncbi:MAG: ComEC/Rec2 family competence protein [Bacillota bacterium]|nr:ComEC/Rec2 family competence protein [Bacillota bacterium]
MRRPLALIGLTYLCVLVVAVNISAFASYILAGIAFVVLIVSLFSKKLRKDFVIPVAAVVAILAIFAYNFCMAFYVEPVHNALQNKDAVICGTLLDAPKNNTKSYTYQLKTKSINIKNENNVPQSVKITAVSSKAIDANVGDSIKCSVHFYGDSGSSYDNYNLSKGIYCNSYIVFDSSVYVQKAESKPVYGYFVDLRERLMNSIDSMLPTPSSLLCKGILLGDKQDLPDDIAENFNDLGIAHAIVVSGMHMIIITSILVSIFKLLTKKRHFYCALTILGVLGFMAVTGFTTSVMRCGILAVVSLFGYIIYRRPDPLNSIGFAAILLTCTNPLAVYDFGMLLSFSAAIGIALWAGKLENVMSEKTAFIKAKHIQKLKFSVISIVSVTSAALIATTPIYILVFKQFPLLVIIANLLVIPVVELILVFIILASVLFNCGVLSFLCYPFALFAGVLSKYIIWITNFLANLPFAYVHTSRNDFKLWLAFTILLIAIAFCFKIIKNRIKLLALLSALLLIVTCTANYFVNYNTTFLTVFNVGEGIAVDLHNKNGEAVVAFSGDNYNCSNVLNQIKSQNKNVDFFCVPYNNNVDNSDLYAQNLLQSCKVSNLLIYNTSRKTDAVDRASKNAEKTSYFNTDYKINIFNTAEIKYIVKGKYVWTYLKIGDTDILICPSKGDASLLPSTYQNPSICVMNEPPKNAKAIHYSYLILSGNSEKTEARMMNPTISGGDVITTADNGDIKISFNDNNVSIGAGNF